MRLLCFGLFLLGCACLFETSARAQGVRYAFVPKLNSIPFFDEIDAGIQEELPKFPHVHYIYQGSNRSDVRLQNSIISKQIKYGLDGLIVSVTNSDFLMKNCLDKLRMRGIPVVTVDSDLAGRAESELQKYRQAYIGTNNLELGRELGRSLAALRVAGTYAVISGNSMAPNLKERIMGLREVLSENGWKEYYRSPIYANDRPQHGLRALKYMLRVHDAGRETLDAVVFLSASVQSDISAYRKLVQKYRSRAQTTPLLLVSVDTSPQQKALIRDGLSDMNIGQATHEMGRLALHTLEDLRLNKSVQRIQHTPLEVCKPKRVPLCILKTTH